jgi:hypothetical protein
MPSMQLRKELADYSGRIRLLLFDQSRRIGEQFFHPATCLCDNIVVRCIPSMFA